MTRPRYQKGSIVERNGNWVLKYYDDRIEAGAVRRVRISKILAQVGNVYRTKSQVRPLADEILATVASQSAGQTDGTLLLSEFVEKKYFPHLEKRQQMHGALHLEPSTTKGYKDIWKFRLKNSTIASIRVRNFTTANAQSFFMGLSQDLSHQSHLRVKAFLSGVFNFAKQVGALSGVNPLDGTKVGGRKSDFKGQAYTLDQILDMLEKLPEPARTVCATAAFTGLSASELRGLRWMDYDGEYLNVSQKVWRQHVGAPKTEARKGAVPVIPALKKILDAFRTEFPPKSSTSDFIFRGSRKGFALNLDNLSRGTIAPMFKSVWSGWHSFRRGIGTRLFYLGADAKTVQTILRHSQVSTTMAHYVIPDQKEMNDAMKKFDEFLGALESKRRGS
jgi:integrase